MTLQTFNVVLFFTLFLTEIASVFFIRQANFAQLATSCIELFVVFCLKILFLCLVEKFGKRTSFRSQVSIDGTVRIVAEDEDGR